ncbi:hypothetical protein Pla52o_47840 [Novipirellula galeiformis]|uniref:Uncharacterized protein n=1 Tax=Novipirellula galeiformis TaxID=2528004 RepID=A0A5C6C8A6_9BACT|nr:hypothetical protein [Novipirellula galeiformis]TWU20267.1 hypothetical protein Pla52o_47840 [Novipirellula galeiformis]
MKKTLALIGVAIAIAAFVIPLPDTRSLQAAPPKGVALPDCERGGTWGFAESTSDPNRESEDRLHAKVCVLSSVNEKGDSRRFKKPCFQAA